MLPTLVLMVLLVVLPSQLWRRAIWKEAGSAVIEVSGTLRGRVRPVFGGWRVDGMLDGTPVRVEWRGGLRGARTSAVWRGNPARTQRVWRWLTAKEVLAALRPPPVARPEEPR